MRIVSLLPAATEICYALGLGDDLVGVSPECDHPLAARAKRIVSRSLLQYEGKSSGETSRMVGERLESAGGGPHGGAQTPRSPGPGPLLSPGPCGGGGPPPRGGEGNARKLPPPPHSVSLPPPPLVE